jgi:hypothetical protein
MPLVDKPQFKKAIDELMMSLDIWDGDGWNSSLVVINDKSFRVL